MRQSPYCLKRETWGQVTSEFELDQLQPRAPRTSRRILAGREGLLQRLDFGESIVWVLGEATQDDPLEVGRYVGEAIRGRGDQET